MNNPLSWLEVFSDDLQHAGAIRFPRQRYVKISRLELEQLGSRSA
jgi:hypothetical protein